MRWLFNCVLVFRLSVASPLNDVNQLIMPRSLPLAKNAGLNDVPDALGAYNACLALERNATTNENRIHARILGYLILHVPSSIARAEVVGLIRSYGQGENALLELGEHFLLYFICPCESCTSSAGWERI